MQVCLYVAVVDDDRFRALAHPSRRALLRLVRDEARSVGELAEAIDVSQPATSQHLAVLRDAGLVTVERQGRSRLYRADAATLSDLRQFFDGFWSTAADRLQAVAEAVAAGRSQAS
jgi:DNA-binding transcriptional ArsR family regulator